MANKTFTISELRELAGDYNSNSRNAYANLIGNNAIREFLIWANDKSDIAPQEGQAPEIR